jgi:hypothetical protein
MLELQLGGGMDYVTTCDEGRRDAA